MSFRVNLDSLAFKEAVQDKWVYDNDFSNEISEYISNPEYQTSNRYKRVISTKVLDAYNYFASLKYADFIDFYRALGEKKRSMLYQSIMRFCFTCQYDTDVDIIYISTMRNFWQRVLLSSKVSESCKHQRMSSIRDQLEKIGLIYRVTQVYEYSHRRLPVKTSNMSSYVFDPEHTYSYMYVVNMHLVHLLLAVNKSMLDANICLAVDKAQVYTDRPTKTDVYTIYQDMADIVSAKVYDTNAPDLPSILKDYLKSKTSAEVFTDVYNAIDIFKKMGNNKPTPELILAAYLPNETIINILAAKYPFLIEAWEDVALVNQYIADDDYENEQLSFKFNIDRKNYTICRKTGEKVQYLSRISIRNTSSIVSYKANADENDASYVTNRQDYLSYLAGKPFVENEKTHWDRAASVPTTLRALQTGEVWDNDYDFYTEEVIKKSDINLTRDQVKDVILPVIFDKVDPVLNKLRRERQKEYKTLQTELYQYLLEHQPADFNDALEQGQFEIKAKLNAKYAELKPYYEKIIGTVKKCVDNCIDTSMSAKVFLYESIIYIRMRKAMYEQGVRHISQVYDSFYFLDENCPDNINDLFKQYALEVYKLKQLENKNSITNYTVQQSTAETA